MRGEFAGKVAFITGAAHGQGETHRVGPRPGGSQGRGVRCGPAATSRLRDRVERRAGIAGCSWYRPRNQCLTFAATCETTPL